MQRLNHHDTNTTPIRQLKERIQIRKGNVVTAESTAATLLVQTTHNTHTRGTEEGIIDIDTLMVSNTVMITTKVFGNIISTHDRHYNNLPHDHNFREDTPRFDPEITQATSLMEDLSIRL